jgi:spore coat polysaccharide biosynthesis protein SpsF (cytidylyltransferase family)
LPASRRAAYTRSNNDIDYLNNGTSGLPDGLGCQLFTTRALEISYNLTNKSLDFEHVTAHIIRNSTVFRSLYPNVPTSLFWPEVSFSLDEQDDYRFLNEIILNCEDNNFFFGTKTLIDFLRSRPDLVQMNSEIRRRGYE